MQLVQVNKCTKTAKRCGEFRTSALLYVILMKRAFLTALQASRETIKELWRANLRKVPLHTPLANPDLLAFMMDESLDEVLPSPSRIESSRPQRADWSATSELAKQGQCCGLNPYIAYFLAGEAALVAVIRGIEPGPRLSENDILTSETELLFSFRVASHREINAFCEICQISSPSAGSTDHYTRLPDACPFKQAEPPLAS